MKLAVYYILCVSIHIGCLSNFVCITNTQHWKTSYKHVHSAAHAVLLVLVMHDGPVVQQPLQQTHHQRDEILARPGQVLVLPAVLQ